MRSLTTILKNHGALLVSGVLAGVTLTGCPGPKQIGEESDTNIMGEMCQDGETKKAPDGCNDCTCVDGDWACTDKACNDEGPDPEPECQDGDMMPAPDGCNDCTCYMGQWACTEKGCVATSGDPGETGAGETYATGETGVLSDGTSEGGETGVEPGVCGDGELTEAEECDDGNHVDGDGCSGNCTLEGGLCQDKPQDALEVEKAAIEADSLVIDVAFGGGCAEHDIGYCWDGSFAESDPVQTWLDLWHDGHDDNCDAYLHEQRILDLTELKTAWQTGYQMDHGEIIIHLEGWAEQLVYAF